MAMRELNIYFGNYCAVLNKFVYWGVNVNKIDKGYKCLNIN